MPDFGPQFSYGDFILTSWQVKMCHEIIPKTLFVPFGDILTIVYPFALVLLLNADRDVIPNQNSALFLECVGSLLRKLGFSRRQYDLKGVMRSCIQLFGWASFCSFARCGGLRGETFVNVYVYNIHLSPIFSHITSDCRISYIYLAGLR
jgi:hypothetical protein